MRDSMRRTNDTDTNLSEDSKRKSKSIEVFDFYVNSIDDNVYSSTRKNGTNVESQQDIKTDTSEKHEIEDILNTAPIDTKASFNGE